MTQAITCRDEIALLADYLDGVLPPEDLARVEAHLAECPNCEAFLRDYRETPRILREATTVEMPPELEERLRKVLEDGRPKS